MVRLGSINLVTKDDHTHIVAIDKIIVHPGYRRRYKYDDIALIRMSRTIYFNEFIRPACLNINHNIKWSTAIATGFGVTATGNYLFANSIESFLPFSLSFYSSFNLIIMMLQKTD